ncbi:MAG: hypothetical protein M1829_002003 [Trizodia sp. TS-e1964]|nr:MAG: hypothetical protein M1829_002003 [Trizodia sp. TS-e1964]
MEVPDPKKLKLDDTSSPSPSQKLDRVDGFAKPFSAALNNSFPLVTWVIARCPTNAHYLIQSKSCNSLAAAPHQSEHWVANGSVAKCTTCIEKAAGGGSCRFKDIRAFAAVKAGHFIDRFLNNERKVGGFQITDTVIVKPVSRDCAKKLPKNGGAITGFKGQEFPDLKDWVFVSNTAPNDVKAVGIDESDLDQYPHGPSDAMNRILARVVDNKQNKNSLLDYLDQSAGKILTLTAPTIHEAASRFLRQLIASGRNQAPVCTPVVYRNPIAGERITCDACGTSCFLGAWIGNCCGAEMCILCWESWKPPTISEANIPQGVFIARYDQCNNKKRHVKNQFTLVCRASKKYIEWIVEKSDPSRFKADVELLNFRTGDIEQLDLAKKDEAKDFPFFEANCISGKDLETESMIDNLSATFSSLWYRRGNPEEGEPLVVKDLLDRFNQDWSPHGLMKLHGNEACSLVDCQKNGSTTDGTISQFFAGFDTNTYRGTERSLKLKDWPPSQAFAEHCPGLFEDFERALPFPEYMCHDGFKNLAAYFPSKGYLRPDLGPKGQQSNCE